MPPISQRLDLFSCTAHNTDNTHIYMNFIRCTYVCGCVGSSPSVTVSPGMSLKHFWQKVYLSERRPSVFRLQLSMFPIPKSPGSQDLWGSHIHKTQPVHQASTGEETNAAENVQKKTQEREKWKGKRKRKELHKQNKSSKQPSKQT